MEQDDQIQNIPSTEQIVKPKNYFLPVLATLVVLLLVGIGGYSFYQKRVRSVTTLSPTTAPEFTITNALPINAGEIGLIEDNKIEILDTSNWKRKGLSIPNLKKPVIINFSRDGNILFISSFDDEFIIYDLTKNKTVTLPNMKYSPRVDTPDDVSPDGKYFILTQSCCPGDSDKSVITIDGKIIKVLHGGVIIWSPDSNILAINKGDYTIPIDLVFPNTLTNNSIYLEQISGNTVVEKLLVKATNQTSYEPIQWNSDHSILVKKTVYKEPFPKNIDTNNKTVKKYWEDNFNTPTIIFIDIDVNTLHQTANTQYSPPPPTDYSSDNYESFISYSPDKKWKVFTQYTSGVARSRYISKIDGSNKIKVSDDAYVIWKPQ